MPETEAQRIEREGKEQEKQGNEMLEFDGLVAPTEGDFIPAEVTPPAAEEKPPVETPPETPPVETAPPETPPAEAPSAETPPVETPPVEGEKPPEKSEIEVMKEKMAAMEEQNTALVTRLEADGVPPATPAEEPAEEKPPAEVKISEFATEEEHTDMFSNRETLNKVLSRVYQAGREVSMRDLPELVRPEVRRQLAVEKRVDAFFGDNKDLLRVRKYVGKVAAGLAIKDGSKSVDTVLTDAGKLVREELKIPKEEVEVKGKEDPKVTPVSGAVTPNPAFASAPGGGVPAIPAEAAGKKLPTQEQEVSDMIDFAEENG